ARSAPGQQPLALLDLRPGELVATLVFRMAGMALQPVPSDVVAPDGLVQPAPEILVLHCGLGRGLPAIALPAVDPAGDAVAQIDAVRVELDLHRPLERLQGADRRHELHAVVGGEVLAAGQLALRALPAEHRRPAARAGIAAAAAIGVDDDRG